jgi:hypothetical protein
MRRFAIATACLALACAPTPRAPDVGAGVAVRADFVDGIILLDATLAGGQGWWLLDSGYEYSLLDSTAAQGASVAVSAPETVAAPGGSVTQSWAGGVSLDIAGTPFHPDSIAVLPLQHLAPVMGKPIAGLLGHDFFERHVVTIDYAAREVRLASPDGWRPPAGSTLLPVWIEAGEPFVLGTLWVAGRTVPAKLKLDTGSFSGLGLNGSFVAQNRLFPADWPRRPVEGLAVGGATRNFVSRLDSMALGGLVIPRPVVGWSEDLTRIGDAGTLGAPNLARFRVTFDYARRRLVLEPYPDAAHREIWEGAGLFLVQVPGGDVIVALVLPATPADSAHIAVGDVLRRLGVSDASTIGLDSLRRHFRHPGQVDTLVVARGDVERSITLRQVELP